MLRNKPKWSEDGKGWRRSPRIVKYEFEKFRLNLAGEFWAREREPRIEGLELAKDARTRTNCDVAPFAPIQNYKIVRKVGK